MQRKEKADRCQSIAIAHVSPSLPFTFDHVAFFLLLLPFLSRRSTRTGKKSTLARWGHRKGFRPKSPRIRHFFLRTIIVLSSRSSAFLFYLRHRYTSETTRRRGEKKKKKRSSNIITHGSEKKHHGQRTDDSPRELKQLEHL